MSVLFIVNPIAGKGNAKTIVPIIEKICREKDIVYEIIYTKSPKNGTEIAIDGVKKGFERIIAVGGDGTLNEVLNGVVGSEVALGIIPAGSGNDFVRTINTSKEIEKIILDNIFGKIKCADLGKCNGINFINIASVGFDAKVVDETQRAKRFFSGSLAYIAGTISTIFKYKGIKATIDIDGNITKENILLLAAANGRYYGGGMIPAPNADIYDGLFDICIIKKAPKIKLLGLFPRFMKGKHLGIKEVSIVRGKKVTIESDDKFYVNIDGEVIEGNKMNFEIVPECVNIIIPE